MTIQHEDITDPYLHEPKGAAAASGDTVYIADGAGSGSWSKVNINQINTAYTQSVKDAVETEIGDGTIPLLRAETYMHVTIPDISTADTIYIHIPEDSTLIQAGLVLGDAITVADATIDFKNAAGTSMGQQGVAFSGSATGDTYVFVPTGNEDLTGPTYMTVETDGGSTTTAKLFITLHFYVTRTIPA